MSENHDFETPGWTSWTLSAEGPSEVDELETYQRRMMFRDESDEEAYDEYNRLSELHYLREQRTGYGLHSSHQDWETGKTIPGCGQWALKTRFFPTRQYGGGYDSTEHCVFCGHKDVFV